VDFVSDLGKALRSNTSLKILDMAYNNIQDKMGPSLVKLIKEQAE